MLNIIELKQLKDKGGWWLQQDFVQKLKPAKRSEHFDIGKGSKFRQRLMSDFGCSPMS